MDITLPETDGLEACRRLKTVDRLRDIPIIMVTGREKTVLPQKAFEAGAIDYINKPLDRVELLARVRAALKLKQEIDARKGWEVELGKTMEEKNRTIERMKTLCELIPICSSCHSLSQDHAVWHKLEDHLHAHPEIKVSKANCPTCSHKSH